MPRTEEFSRGSDTELDKLRGVRCVVGMPFQDFKRFFSPDELDAMTAAYNGAYQQLMAVTAVISGDMKAKLARILLAAACTGKRDKELLEDVALRALAHKPPAYTSEDGQAAERLMSANDTKRTNLITRSILAFEPKPEGR